MAETDNETAETIVGTIVLMVFIPLLVVLAEGLYWFYSGHGFEWMLVDIFSDEFARANKEFFRWVVYPRSWVGLAEIIRYILELGPFGVAATICWVPLVSLGLCLPDDDETPQSSDNTTGDPEERP